MCAAEMSSKVILLSTPENQIFQDENEGPPAKSRDEAVLKGVVACVEVRTRTENRSKGVAYQLEQLGAKVVTKLDNDVTHVIWKDGKKPTLERARKRGLHVVSVLWVESCKQNQEHVAESMFAVTGQEEGSPLFVPKMKRRKFMEPKDLEEDLQDSRERLAKRRKRRDAPLTVSIPGRVLAENTPYRHSPTRYLPGPPYSPSLIPNTPDSMRACLDKLDSIKAQSPFVYQKPTLGESPTCGTFNYSGSPSNSPLEKREVVGSLIDRLLASDTDEPSPLERVCLKSVGSQDAQSHRTKLSKALFQFESSSGFEGDSVKEKSGKLRNVDMSRQDSSLGKTGKDGGRKTEKRTTRASLGRGKRRSPQATGVEEESDGDKRTEPLVFSEALVGENGVTEKRIKSLGKKGKISSKVGAADDGNIVQTEDIPKVSQNMEKIHSLGCSISVQSKKESNLKRVNEVSEEERLPSKIRRRSSRGKQSLPVKVDAKKELTDDSEVPGGDVGSKISGVEGTGAKLQRRSSYAVRGSRLPLLEEKNETNHKEIKERENGTGKRLSRKTRGQDSRTDSEVMTINLDSPEDNINDKSKKENIGKNSDDIERQEGDCKDRTPRVHSDEGRKGQDVRTDKDKGNDRTPGQKRPLKDTGDEGEAKRRPKRRKLLKIHTYEEPPSILIDPKECANHLKSESKTTEKEEVDDHQKRNKSEGGKKMRKRLPSKTKKDLQANCQTESMVQLSPQHRRSVEDFKDVSKELHHIKADEEEKLDDSGIESSKNVSMDSNGSPANDSDGKSGQEIEERLKRNKTGQNKQPSKPRKPTVVMTSLHKSEQDVVVSVIRKLGGFKITDSVGDTTTHVIIGDPRRTLNVLSAIGHGCWLLSKEWVLNSLESGHWLPEEPFEVHSAFPAAKLSRELKAQSIPGQTHLDLFSEFGSIFISESSSPPSERLADLILLCGGSVSRGQRQADLCVGRATLREEVTVVQEKWVLDCISEMKSLPVGPYKLQSDVKTSF